MASFVEGQDLSGAAVEALRRDVTLTKGGGRRGLSSGTPLKAKESVKKARKDLIQKKLVGLGCGGGWGGGGGVG